MKILPPQFDSLSQKIIGLAIEVHRILGPGLLEAAYEHCLCHEFDQHLVEYRRQVPLPLRYKGAKLDCGYRLDILVENALVIEIKAVEKLLPIHSAQMLTYLKLSPAKIGILMNFNTVELRNGLRRLELPDF